MNSTANQPWSQPEQLDPMAHMSNNDLDDLSNLFEFGDIDLNTIPNVGDEQYGGHMSQPQHISHPSTPFDGMSIAPPPPGTSTQDFGGQDQYALQQDLEGQHGPYAIQAGGHAPTSHPFTAESMYQPSMQHSYSQPNLQHFQYQQQQQGYPSGSHVPPTPNSFEMHGEAGRFMQQQQFDAQQRAILEQRYHLRKDDAIAFTPMVSPAGTPQYHVPPEFAVPGAYFSPLTSPMLHAQQQSQPYHAYRTNPSTAPSSNPTSPIDPNVDVDMLGEMSLPESAVPKPKRPKRKVATAKSLATKSRQSPFQKPQKRKSGSMLSSIVPASEIDTIMAEAQRSATSQPGSAGLQMPPAFNTSSEDGSISPEPLNESVMGPPPRPGSSVNQSPAITAQQTDAKAAATPKSLLTKSGSNQQQINGVEESISTVNGSAGLDDLQLPEAAAESASQRPSLSQIVTQLPSAISSTEQMPRMTARKTPKLGPLSTPCSTRPQSSHPSPSAIASPMSATTPGSLLKDKKVDAKGARTNKKRGSISGSGSNLASPALRPKISPSIKPLLPEGTPLNSPTHALLLASKSNYQNLLEGNHLPGVSYPDSLSSGLSSKRTSHKVAEQGRRNRINDALKEMQALVPKEYLSSKLGKTGSNEDECLDAGGSVEVEIEWRGGEKDRDRDDVTKSHSSKAATVESANVYIRNMQRLRAEEGAENERLRGRVEEMERRLAAAAAAASKVEGGEGEGEGEGSGEVQGSASPGALHVEVR